MPVQKLPPLILHPFADNSVAGTLADGSRAGLMLEGVLPRDGCSSQDLEERFLGSRYCELRMLFYLGKDLERWTHQCAEVVAETDAALREHSFALLLVDDTPAPVRDKLARWGVHDFRNIFVRALGIRTLFQELPDRRLLAPDFLRFYHRFADQVFAAREMLFPSRRAEPDEFAFELYASAEYSRLLEQEWSA
jgi:hypothetical protein